MTDNSKSTSLQFIRGYLQLNGFSKRQQRYYQWQVDTAKAVNTVSYKSNPELKELVEEYLLPTYTPLPKACYTTAVHTTLAISNVKYVEGYVTSIIPFQHAWNEWNGIYFDLTAELAQIPNLSLNKNLELEAEHEKEPYTDYQAILSFDAKKVLEYQDRMGYLGDFVSECYRLIERGEKQ